MTTTAATTRTFRTNLNCGACVAQVVPHLDALLGFQTWQVDTSDPNKPLTIRGVAVDVEAVRAAVARAGFAVYEEIEPAGSSTDQQRVLPLGLATSPAATESVRPAQLTLATYYPLLLIVGYLLGIVLLVEAAQGDFRWMRAMNHFMGGFFLAFSFFKLLDVRGFANAFRMYDLVAKALPGYALVYPFIELGLGIGYLVQFNPLLVNSLTLIVMVVGAIGVVRSLTQRQQIRCACLGTVFNLPMSVVTLTEDALMAGMAAVMLLAHLLA